MLTKMNKSLIIIFGVVTALAVVSAMPSVYYPNNYSPDYDNHQGGYSSHSSYTNHYENNGNKNNPYREKKQQNKHVQYQPNYANEVCKNEFALRRCLSQCDQMLGEK